MAKDPAFLFYPGDYLRDTQCLSESVQVAYDRIMCEHMRNICISQAQLNFFTKRLTNDQKEELMMVLDKTEEGFYIHWVHESIIKRKAYSKSRSQNRLKSHDKHMKTYDNHMENANISENGDVDLVVKEALTPQARFINKFSDIYKLHTNLPYDIKKTEYVLISQLIKKHTLPVVQLKTELLIELCKNRSAWFTKDGFSCFNMGTLVKHFNAITKQEQTGEKSWNKL